jgi:Fe-S cluster assembly protein SufB
MKFDQEIKQVINKPYIYGFKTNILKETIKKGLSERIIYLISKKKKEPLFILQFRLSAFKIWKKFEEPDWSSLTYDKVNYQEICYYSAPKQLKNKLNKVNPELVHTFKKLGISISDKNNLDNFAVDLIFDSISVVTTYKSELAKFGVIFCSISEGILLYPELIKIYLGKIVPPTDNFFAALNSSIFTDGSFCYVPKKIKCPLELSTYFRINDKKSGQFERTLIVAEENSQLTYLEGCTAPKYDVNQLHAAVVEIIALDNASIKYSTVQNWYAGDRFGKGGIFNFVTKRGLCAGSHSKISWTQVETGSALTWKYPSCVLSGSFSKGEFYSVALTLNFQQADTGTKMLHLSRETKSRIISKGISSGQSKNTYRGLVKFALNALHARNFSKCDSLLLGTNASANTFPYINIQNANSKIEHEASTSKIGEEQLFYLQQRGIRVEQAIGLIISGFCREIFTELPIEFALEADKLLNLNLEGAVG